MSQFSPQQVSIFVETFYQTWSTKTLQTRNDYQDSVIAADLAADLAPGTIPPGSIPSFDQLTGGSATRTSGGATSSGAQVLESQQAQNSGANPIDPPSVPTATVLSPTAVAQAADRAIQYANDVTQVGSQIQATRPGNVNIGSLVPTPRSSTTVTNDRSFFLLPDDQRTGTTPGAFANDDGGRSNDVQVRDLLRQRIDTLYGTTQNINNQTNVLSQYENSTYTLSWYISPTGFNPQTGRAPGNYFLLAQSGGTAGTAGSVQSNQVDATGGLATAPVDYVSTASRNPFFDVDFFIDNMEVVTRFPLAGTRMSHTNTEISFTVTEPYGLSLIPRLQNAIEDVYKQAGIFTASGAGYASALYLMVIKYWGQKETGELEPVRSPNGVLVQKVIPFKIRELRFSQGTRFVEYRIVGNPPFTYWGFGHERGVILEKYTLTGRTVKDVLVGQAAATGTAASSSNEAAAQGRETTASVTESQQNTVVTDVG